MAGSFGRAAGVALLTLSALATVGVGVAPAQWEQIAAPAPPREPHVRGADQRSRLLLEKGAAGSTTFRSLLEVLDRSDVIVHVQTVAYDRPATLVFVSARGGARFLRILVRACGRPEDEAIAWLGHELQHAAEIAAAPDVADDDAVLRLFHRIGFTSRSTAETREAEQVWGRVLDEVRAVTSRRKSRRGSAPSR